MTEINAAFNKVKNYANETIKIYKKYPEGKQIEIVTKTILVAILAGLFGGLIFDIIGFLAVLGVSGIIAFDYFNRHPKALDFYAAQKQSHSRPLQMKPVRYRYSPPPYQKDQLKHEVEYYAAKGKNTVSDFVEDVIKGPPTQTQQIQRSLRDGWRDVVHDVKKFFRT